MYCFPVVQKWNFVSLELLCIQYWALSRLLHKYIRFLCKKEKKKKNQEHPKHKRDLWIDWIIWADWIVDITCYINQLHIACTSCLFGSLVWNSSALRLAYFPMLLDSMVKFWVSSKIQSIICVIYHTYINFVLSKNSFISFTGLLAESYKLQNLTFAFCLLFLFSVN